MYTLAQIWHERGNNFLKLGNYDNAIGCFNEVLNINPQHEKATISKLLACKARAQELFDLHLYDLALKYCDEGLTIKSDDSESLIQRQYILHNLESKKSSSHISRHPAQVKITPPMEDLDALTAYVSIIIARQEQIEKANAMQNIIDRLRKMKPSKLAVSPVSAAEAAVFSKDVYFQAKKNPSAEKGWMPLPDGWALYDKHISATNGYVGAIYIKNKDNPGGPTGIVIAHRGTVLNSLSDLEADWGIAEGIMSAKLYDLICTGSSFYEDARNNLIKTYGSQIVFLPCVVTGHSLGAVIAQFAPGYEFPVITFENPGAKNIIRNHLEKWVPADEVEGIAQAMESHHTAYQAHINIINSIQPQGGEVYELLNLECDYSFLLTAADMFFPSLSPDWRLNKDYILCYSILDQHDMERIRNYLHGHGILHKAQYPTGLKAGYAEYLNPSRKTYWQGYAQAFWNTHPLIHVLYNKDYDTYYIAFNESLTRVWQTAVELANGVSVRTISEKENAIISEVKSTQRFGMFKCEVIIEKPESPETNEMAML